MSKVEQRRRNPVHAQEFIKIRGGLCHFAPEGEVTLVEGVALVTEAITHCREQDARRMFIDVRRLTGYAVPTLVDRFWLAQDWAEAAQGMVTVAVVALVEHVHPGKFGVKVANDAGMQCDVFTSEEPAMQWLSTIATN